MPRDPFDDFNDAFRYSEQFWGKSMFEDFFNFRTISADDQQLLDCIKEEATEYYSREFKVDLKRDYLRKALSKEQKERVVGFMKQRLLWYGENGFLLKG